MNIFDLYEAVVGFAAPVFNLLFRPNVAALEARRDVAGLTRALRYRWDTIVRMRAAKALGRIGDSSAVESLARALKDSEKYVSMNATEALGKIGNRQAVEPLIEAFLKPIQYWEVQREAADALGKIGDPRAVEPLVKSLRDRYIIYSDSGVRRTVALALGKLGEPAIEPLVSILNDKSILDFDRRNAVEALGVIGDPRVIEPLIRALADRNFVESAAWALEHIGEPAVGPLIEAAKEKRPGARVVLKRMGIQEQ